MSDHVRAIVTNLLAETYIDRRSICGWLGQERGADANIKAIVGVLAAHSDLSAAARAAWHLQSAVDISVLEGRYNIMEMLEAAKEEAGQRKDAINATASGRCCKCRRVQ
jgi:hypothetical protein